MTTHFEIAGRRIGAGEKTFIIAELSANHGGSLEIVFKTVWAAAESGADALKLQTYRADTMTLNIDNPEFMPRKGSPWEGTPLYKLYQGAQMPWEWHAPIMEEAEKAGLVCFSSPFDATAVDFLEDLNAPAYKIASFEVTDIPLIRKAASTGKPVIISTGLAAEEDIRLAVATCREVSHAGVALLKCTSSYPAPIDRANLLTIPDLAKRFGVIPGLSDHTLGGLVPALSVALGAKIIEKHFILDKEVGGPDASFSMLPGEFKTMVEMVRDAEKAMGKAGYELAEGDPNRRRSLYVSRDVNKGEIFNAENVKSIRPGFGLHPKFLDDVLGKTALMDIEAGTPLSFEHFQSA